MVLLPGLAAPVSAAGWSKPELIDNPNGWESVISRPQFDTTNMGGIAYTQADITGPYKDKTRLWFKRYTPGNGWGNASLIFDGNNKRIGYPRLHIDRRNNAFTSWSQQGRWGVRSDSHKWFGQYTAGKGWSKARAFINRPGNAYDPTLIRADGHGNVIAIWSYNQSDRHAIWVKRYTQDKGWSRARRIFSNPFIARPLALRFDRRGNAIALWMQALGKRSGIYADGFSRIWASRYSVGKGWGKPVILAHRTKNTYEFQLDLDHEGNALFVWVHDDDDEWNVWANRYTVGKGWSKAKFLEDERYSDGSREPQLRFDSDGNAFVIWWKRGIGKNYYHIWVNRYIKNKGWSKAQSIDGKTVGSSSARIATDHRGNAIAVWRGIENDVYTIRASRYHVGKGWGKPMLLSRPVDDNKFDPDLVFDAAGNACVIWWQRSRSASIWSRCYMADKGWGKAIRIQRDRTATASRPSIYVDPRGTMHAIWRQHYKGVYHHWTSRYK